MSKYVPSKTNNKFLKLHLKNPISNFRILKSQKLNSSNNQKFIPNLKSSIKIQ